MPCEILNARRLYTTVIDGFTRDRREEIRVKENAEVKERGEE